MLADLPADLKWEFGGFAYGLEPLTLPEPGAPDDATAFGADLADAYSHACELIWDAQAGDVPGLVPGISKEELYWFRWITGHQLSFISWRLMAQLADDAESGRLPAEIALAQMRRYVLLYSAMLVYTGSCPRGLYHDVIRPSMWLRHRSFSGSWAPDFWPVRDLLRVRHLAFPPSDELTEFVKAVKVHQLVHDGIAARLVPNGASLLRQSSARRMDMRLLHVIYDNYFLTLRAQVGRHEVVAQLLRRVMAITQDVAVNGLCPDGDGSELPAELLGSGAIASVNEFAGILLDAACAAAGSPVGARTRRTAVTR